jgi:voltage-gated potassium channel Kch
LENSFETFYTIGMHGFLVFTDSPLDDDRVVLADEEKGEYWVTDLSDLEILTKSIYYALTTLSTIGYGDMSPITISEKMVGSVILLFGVALFSNFIGFL